jgi:signal transduction histidine kinase
MAREKLGADGDPAELAAVRELVDAAHQGAKDALVELRDLAKGIHPPVLDNGLPDALATLVAGSAVPVTLTTTITRRPSGAIESIAYFCAAELLSNAVKHSGADTITVNAAEQGSRLCLTVNDNGAGGSDPHGSGLSGLAQRIRAVDGHMEISSPPGGPTRIRIDLPLRA